MLDDMPTTADLLTAWRDATRAAELARRLAEAAEGLAEAAMHDALAAEEVAALADIAAQAAETAASRARATADRMRGAAETATTTGRHSAAAVVTETNEKETSARDRYHAAEREARTRQDGEQAGRRDS